MHPATLYEIAKARTAEELRLASQDAIARAARRARHAQLPPRRHLANVARRVVTLPVARDRLITARPRPWPRCQPPAPCRACT
jgi:hypothetical protein